MLLTEIKYQLFRNKGRSALLLCIAALLLGTMALYLGNIQQNQTALENLGENVPVTVRITSEDGLRSSGLMIPGKYYDALAQGGVRDLLTTTTGAGVLDETVQKELESGAKFTNGDVILVGVNRLEAYPMKKMTYEYLEGESAACLEGTEPKCLLDGIFAENHGIQLGDTISLPVYIFLPSIGYEKICDGALTVAGFYRNEKKQESTVNMLAPVEWMRTEAEKSGFKAFSYDSCSALLADPLNMNDFKDRMSEAGFLEPVNPEDQNNQMGDALSVEDKLFIKTVNKIQENLASFRLFLLPFFVLMVGLVTLAIFLTLRGGRKDAAIANSLGRSKTGIALSQFFSVLALSLLGCVIAFPVMVLAAGLSLFTVLTICGIFLICSCAGTALALCFLLRFDAMALLTKVD